VAALLSCLGAADQPRHWDERRKFPKSEWGMFAKRMPHVPAFRRSLRLPDARSRHWNETFSQIVAVARRLAVV
jgi:hypothetical protein